MKLSWFVSVNMIILVGLLHVYHWAKSTYDEKDMLAYKIRSLTKQLHHAELEVALVQDQFLGFRQEVASFVPELLKTHEESPKSYQLRSIASVTQRPSESEAQKKALSEVKFQTAVQAFQKKNYSEAEILLKSFISDYGYSARAPEAYLLLVESLYQDGKVEEAVERIRVMIDLFPGHEVSGFSMIRLGKIMESRGRASDAIDIYKTVLRTFPQREVASQAKASLSGVGF